MGQMIEFNLILKAANAPIGPAGFWKLLIGTVLMLAFGYAGESGAINAWIGFGLGMCGWGFILFEIFAGESAKASAGGNVTVAVRQSYNNMRIIVSCGWAIYPAGYFLGQVNNTAGAAEALNVTYNIADFVNKIAFCWHAGLARSLTVRTAMNGRHCRSSRKGRRLRQPKNSLATTSESSMTSATPRQSRRATSHESALITWEMSSGCC